MCGQSQSLLQLDVSLLCGLWMAHESAVMM